MSVTDSIRRAFGVGRNEQQRCDWVEHALRAIPAGSRILDAGAGTMRFKPACAHLRYVSQDFCQYEGHGGYGLASDRVDYSGIDIVCDIASIPAAAGSFDAVLCTEVLEHVADPVRVVAELARVLRPGGALILTAPFASLTHIAPYFYATGFSRYWYEHHLPRAGLTIEELTANGDWYDVLQQEALRLPGRQGANRPARALATGIAVSAIAFVAAYHRLYGTDRSELACFGWHCVARRATGPQASA